MGVVVAAPAAASESDPKPPVRRPEPPTPAQRVSRLLGDLVAAGKITEAQSKAISPKLIGLGEQMNVAKDRHRAAVKAVFESAGVKLDEPAGRPPHAGRPEARPGKGAPDAEAEVGRRLAFLVERGTITGEQAKLLTPALVALEKEHVADMRKQADALKAVFESAGLTREDLPPPPGPPHGEPEGMPPPPEDDDLPPPPPGDDLPPPDAGER